MSTLNPEFPEQSPPTLLIKKNNDVGVVAPLPDHLRRKWDQPLKNASNRSTSSIQTKLRYAEIRREEFLTWVMEKASRRRKTFQKRKREDLDTSSTLDAKLEAAEQIRCEWIEVRQNKARANKIKCDDIIRKRRVQREQLARRINKQLEAAEQRRLAIIENVKEKLNEQHQRISNILYFYQQQQLKNKENLSAKICAKLYQADTIRENIKAQIAGKGGKKFLKARKTNLAKKMTIPGKQGESVEGENQSIVYEEECFVYAHRIQLVWNRFKKARKSTSQLVDDFISTKVTSLQQDGPPSPPNAQQDIPNSAVFGLPYSGPSQPDSFEHFVSKIQSPETLKKAQTLLQRLNRRLRLSKLSQGNCQSTLRKLFPKVPQNKRLDRYPPRLLLCAYMMISHPEVVFNSSGNLENQLSVTAEELIRKFEALLKYFYTPLPEFLLSPTQSTDQNSSENEPHNQTHQTMSPSEIYKMEFTNFKGHLRAFDNAWVQYLDLFAAWKLQDAACLESELIRMAVEMQKSMMKKCGADGNAPRVQHNLDLQAVVEQVERDHGLLRDRIRRLSGTQGVASMDAAISEAKEAYVSEMEISESDSANFTQNGSNSQSSQNLEAQFDGQSSQIRSEGTLQEQNEQGNELWELLYDPNWTYNMDDLLQQWQRIRSQAAESEYVPSQNIVSQVKQVAERAFWDSISDMINQGGYELPTKISTLVTEILDQFLQIIPETSELYQTIRSEFEIQKLIEQLTQNSAENETLNFNINGLFSILEKVSCLFTEFGAPARAEEGIQAALEVKQKLLSRNQDEDVGKLVSWALKILRTQLQILRVDAANAKLKILAEQLGPNGIMTYFQQKFHTTQSGENGLPQIPKLEDFVQQCMNIDMSELETLASLQVPSNISSGRNIDNGPLNGDFYKPEISALNQASGWQSKFRMGLLQLVSGRKGVCPAIVPDTMLLDIPRLLAVQNDVQRLAVLSFSMLLVQQHCTDYNAHVAESVKQNISQVLKSGGAIRENLLKELSSIVGANSHNGVEKSIDLLLSADSGAYRSLVKKVQQVLQLLLFYGPQNAGAAKVQAELKDKLKHVGGDSLLHEFVSVGSDLAEIAAVQESVYANFYANQFLQSASK